MYIARQGGNYESKQSHFSTLESSVLPSPLNQHRVSFNSQLSLLNTSPSHRIKMPRTIHCSSLELLLIHIFLITGQVRSYAHPWLIFPPTAPTRHQLITGIGIPLGTPESVITGWVVKAQYFLPTSIDDLKPQHWDGWNNSRRSIEKREAVTVTPLLDHYEAYTAREVKVDTEPLPDDDDRFEDADDDYWMKMVQDANKKSPPVEADPLVSEGYNPERSRWTTYKALEQIGAIYGSGGRECVLRSICEAASAEFTHTGGVFAELLHIIFT